MNHFYIYIAVALYLVIGVFSFRIPFMFSRLGEVLAMLHGDGAVKAKWIILIMIAIMLLWPIVFIILRLWMLIVFCHNFLYDYRVNKS